MPVAVLTGGASWFAREAAHLLLEDGWTIVLGEINETNLREVLEAFPGAPVTGARLDVTDLGDVRRFVRWVTETHGQIDALVNIAGGTNYLQMPRRPFHEMPPEDWDLVLKPNLYGVLNCCHAVLPGMIEKRNGVIINLASGMGLRGSAKMSTYTAAKAAVIGFTRSICQEVGPYGIRVNSIAPGSAESRWQPDLQKGGERLPPLGSRTSARDVANAIAFLISDKASHITGACLDVSGGSSLH
jgi:NAD(P)-dependent dehydrogenase (short-subunit alcohol dehydrogenase family)